MSVINRMIASDAMAVLKYGRFQEKYVMSRVLHGCYSTV